MSYNNLHCATQFATMHLAKVAPFTCASYVMDMVMHMDNGFIEKVYSPVGEQLLVM